MPSVRFLAGISLCGHHRAVDRRSLQGHIGLCLPLSHLFAIPVTNTSVNPARSTGPALFAGAAYISQLWLFWLAPIVGAVIAGPIGRWQHEAPDASL